MGEGAGEAKEEAMRAGGKEEEGTGKSMDRWTDGAGRGAME